MLKINEIFYSIQGESSYAGWPTVFVRTSGCPLRCTYCDTAYAYYEGHKMTLDAVIDAVAVHQTKFVCITGGEPLVQSSALELMQRLCDLNYLVSLETSGAVDCAQVDLRVKKIIDVKTPDSGAAGSFLLSNIKYVDRHTEFKFVICSDADFNWAEDFAKTHEMFKHSNVLYSPSFNQVTEKSLANKILTAHSLGRLQLQLHKYIWSAESRGV